jgi:colicin import membrane protein
VDYAAPLPQTEQSNTTALILSALVHLLLIAALFIGVQWKSQAPSSIEVEVWRAAPSPAPVIKPEPLPEPPKPEAKPEPKPLPKVEPPPVKPDIAIKDDKKPKKEEPKKPEPKKEEPKKEEPKKPEPKREVPDFKKQLESEQKQLDQQKAVQDQRARAEAEANQLAQLKAEQASAARNRGLAGYISKISGKIRGNIVLPAAIRGNPEAVFEVTQLPSGEVINVKLRKSSGNKPLDDAIERAILKSSPLPRPDQPDLFQRVLELKYRPLDE